MALPLLNKITITTYYIAIALMSELFINWIYLSKQAVTKPLKGPGWKLQTNREPTRDIRAAGTGWSTEENKYQLQISKFKLPFILPVSQHLQIIAKDGHIYHWT